jgi:cell division septation protein DedD
MGGSGEKKQDEKGLSARYLVVVFLMGVAACAVFFSLGFLVGYNERSSRATAVTEPVTPPPTIPPTVNPPLETIESESKPARATKPSSAAAAAESQGPRAAASQAARGEEVSSGFTVQVVATRSKEDAEKLVKELKSRGYAVFLVTPGYAHASDNLFRVQVGPFRAREEAEKIRDKIAGEGFKPFIRH